MKNIWMDMAYLLIGVLVLLAREPLEQSAQRAEIESAYGAGLSQARQLSSPSPAREEQKIVETSLLGESLFLAVKPNALNELAADGKEHTWTPDTLASRIETMKQPRVVVLLVEKDVTYGRYGEVRSSLQDLKARGMIESLLEGSPEAMKSP